MTPFGNVYYAACDRAHCRWLQAEVTPGESAKRSPAKQLAWLQGGHAVTRRHKLKMRKASATPGVSETHRLSLHKGSEDPGSVSLCALRVACCECMRSGSDVCVELSLLDVIIEWVIKERCHMHAVLQYEVVQMHVNASAQRRDHSVWLRILYFSAIQHKHSYVTSINIWAFLSKPKQPTEIEVRQRSYCTSHVIPWHE